MLKKFVYRLGKNWDCNKHLKIKFKAKYQNLKITKETAQAFLNHEFCIFRYLNNTFFLFDNLDLKTFWADVCID